MKYRKDLQIDKKRLQSYIDKIAGKLVAEGLVASRYTKAEAKRLTKNVVGPAFVHKMIDGFSPEIKKSMIKMRKKK